ncbi:MAG: RdgB/HAM1 family non-canonical purine NTP pyrophosphatase [Candidatus Diapherotrites archaeon]|nr:RdgB/HAM1 family non-canonical purine NTP pyrophosphatase [Candidatus Diapherotrites archaeon]
MQHQSRKSFEKSSKAFLVTSNKGKVKEFSNILGFELEQFESDLDEIQAIDSETVSLHKAKDAFEAMGSNCPIIVEDTALYFSALNGFPGALIKWLEKTTGLEKICRMVDGFSDRSVVAESCVVYLDKNVQKTFRGTIKGTIPMNPVGKNGFGWDSIFIPENEKQTFAQMTQEKKDLISMRKKALLQLKEFMF